MLDISLLLAYTLFDFSHMSPLGRTPAVNFLNYSDSPIPAYLAARGNPDPATLNQAVILGISLEMSRFVDNIVYDPTISLASLFAEQSSTAPLTPSVSELNQALSTGGIVGIIIAAIAFVGIILVVIFVPPVRQAIQPFFRGRSGDRVDSVRSQDLEDDSDGDPASRTPPGDKSHGSNGWVASKKPK